MFKCEIVIKKKNNSRIYYSWFVCVFRSRNGTTRTTTFRGQRTTEWERALVLRCACAVLRRRTRQSRLKPMVPPLLLGCCAGALRRLRRLLRLYCYYYAFVIMRYNAAAAAVYDAYIVLGIRDGGGATGHRSSRHAWLCPPLPHLYHRPTYRYHHHHQDRSPLPPPPWPRLSQSTATACFGGSDDADRSTDGDVGYRDRCTYAV